MKSSKIKNTKTKKEKDSTKKIIESTLTERFLAVVNDLGHNAEFLASDIAKASKAIAKKLGKQFKKAKSAISEKIDKVSTDSKNPVKSKIKDKKVKGTPVVGSVKVEAPKVIAKVKKSINKNVSEVGKLKSTKEPVAKKAPANKTVAKSTLTKATTRSSGANATKKANNPVVKVSTPSETNISSAPKNSTAKVVKKTTIAKKTDIQNKTPKSNTSTNV